MKLGWGKAIPIPPVPFFVLRQEHEAPVAPTGMPFNARPTRRGNGVLGLSQRFPRLGQRCAARVMFVSGVQKRLLAVAFSLVFYADG